MFPHGSSQEKETADKGKGMCTLKSDFICLERIAHECGAASSSMRRIPVEEQMLKFFALHLPLCFVCSYFRFIPSDRNNP